MSKTFTKPATRLPRNIEKDPAFAAAAAAFGNSSPVPPPAADELQKPNQALPLITPPTNTISGQVHTPIPAINMPPFATQANQNIEHIETGKFQPVDIQDRREANYPNKMTIYPGNAERKRLFNLRYEKRVAESIVAEYALEQFFLRHSDEEIVAAIRARGHGLRRKRPSTKSGNT